MSTEAVDWAVQTPTTTSSAKCLLVMLAHCADSDTFEAYPSMAYLEHATRQDRKTILRNTQRLLEAGLIRDTGERIGRTRSVVVYAISCPLVGTPREPPPVDNLPDKQSQKRDDLPDKQSRNRDHFEPPKQSQKRDSLDHKLSQKRDSFESVSSPNFPGNHVKQAQKRDRLPAEAVPISGPLPPKKEAEAVPKTGLLSPPCLARSSGMNTNTDTGSNTLRTSSVVDDGKNADVNPRLAGFEELPENPAVAESANGAIPLLKKQADATPTKKLSCPAEKLLRLFGETLPQLPQPETLSKARRGHLQARWQEVDAADHLESEADGIEVFKGFFERIGQSDFLMGRAPTTGGRKPFKATFDWVIAPQNFVKIAEGNYANHRSAA